MLTAEIIAVGTELLMGDVVNTNAAWLSRELAALGINVYHHVTVGDNPERIGAVVHQALERANLLLFTGGLGPTDDDLTVATLARLFDTPLVTDPDSEAAIKQYIIARGMPMSTRSLKQALKPEDAATVANPLGTAPGIFWKVLNKVGKPAWLATFPGVPNELYAMWPQVREAIQALQQQHGEEQSVISSRFMHFFGIGESKLNELLQDLMTGENPSVAPYVGRAEVKIRLAAKAQTREAALALMAPLETEITNRCGEYWYGTSESVNQPVLLEAAVGEILKQQRWTVSVAESCTGGLVSSRLTDVPGSSSYILMNAVTYSNEQKVALLEVLPETLQIYGAVSEQAASEMAAGIRKKSGSDIGVSLTGIAGPDGGSAEKPVGLVYIGISTAERQEPLVHTVQVNSRYNRTDMKHWFSQYALFYLRRFCLEQAALKRLAIL